MSKTRSESAENKTAQHTPKPWLIEETRNAKKWPLFEITAGNHSIADLLVSGPGESHDADGGQARQNAHLIAAAPDMLEALKAQHDAIDILFAMLILEHHQGFLPSESGQPWEAMIKGNDAIDKAEGSK